MIAFGQALPRIRRRVSRDLRRPGLPRERVLAAVVRLLENDRGAGRQRGVRAGQQVVRPHDPARPPREGRQQANPVPLPRQGREGTARWRSRTPDWRASSGAARTCPARSCSRTWTRTARSDSSAPPTSTTTSARSPATTSRQRTSAPGRPRCWRRGRWPGGSRHQPPRCAKRDVVRAVERVAEWLGNTPAVSRKSYVHPMVIDAYLEGDAISDGPGGRGAGPPAQAREERLGLQVDALEPRVLRPARDPAALRDRLAVDLLEVAR